MLMELIEDYVEFEGSNVRIWKRVGNQYNFFFKLFNKYHWEILNDKYKEDGNFGDTITLRQARNDALSYLLDKEWDNLPPRMRVENGRKINYR